MSRGAPLTLLDDPNELDGPRIDVGSRIGWTLRMARLAPGPRRVPRLEDMAERTGTNVTRLHRVETGRIRDGSIVDAYERSLELPRGSLRAPVDILCRGFPYSPREREPGVPPATVPELSRLTEAVWEPPTDRPAAGPDGGAWLAWARGLAQTGAIGLPERLGRELIGRLVSEMSRSCGHAYPARYEALALLRCSGYGHLVVDLAREVVSDPGVQLLFDLASAVGEAVTPEAVTWAVELLGDPRDRVVVAGALALENMAEVSGDRTFWAPLVEPLGARFEVAETGSAAWEWISHLLRLVPKPLMAKSPRARALAPVAAIPNWSRTRVNRHWSDCQERARAVCNEAGIVDQPMLARLLFDIAVGPHETRAVTAYMLLGGLPFLAAPVARQVSDLAETDPDRALRDRAARRLLGLLGAQPGDFAELAERWLSRDEPERRHQAMFIAGGSGHRLPARVLLAALDEGPGANRPVLHAAGMTGHPLLRDLAHDGLDPEVRAGAAWWLRQGSRVVDPA